MELLLDNICKRYTTGWVLKDISKQISAGTKISVTGNNGSGKSTLIQIMSGYLSATKGQLTYSHKGEKIGRDNIYKYLSISTAYSELDEELSIRELYEHYQLFKPLQISDYKAFLELTDFVKESEKQVRTFSSGMKQRLSLALAITADVPLVILDEPTSFLDDERKVWYHKIMSDYTKEKTVVIASNDPSDIRNCTDSIDL